MKKAAAATVGALLLAGALYGGLVDAVSIVVDGQPITLYEIYKTERQLGLSKQKAVEFLIKEKLKEEELRRLGIRVDEFDVNTEIEKIAQQNGIDSLKLRAIVAQRGIDWKTYKEQVKEKLLRDKLYRKILSTKIQPPSEDTLKEYYRLHLSEFSVPEAIDVIQYTADTRRKLKEAIANPLADIPGVTREAKRLPASKLNRQLLYMLTQTPKGRFSETIPVAGKFVTFYIKDFLHPHPVPYEKVKQQVYLKWMEQKRAEAIKSHFEKLRAAADIVVLRAP